ncbi:MAG: protein kinase domain-containing protein [Thermoanaerobaculia bacterium]
MTLQAGTRLGPYEILAPLGAGGMGEVYRARDTRLGRAVAVKVLPQHLSASPEVRQRFEREAKTISQLSHAHICALYDVGSHEGTEYLVMELLEGETLADRLANGPLPLAQTLRYGAEIADALDKAHRQGIVHRDLKPGNVMLTKSGVKLLDFGLSKLMTPETLPSDLTSSPTVDGRTALTQEGTILGTFPYMAPEQLEGKQTDGRTDIFAFGATLYEMATGRRAFSGSNQASLVSAILRDEPAPISSIQLLTPVALDRVVRKCLAKDPEDRWQNAADLGSELQWIGEGASQAGTAAPGTSRNRRRERLAWAVAATLFVALAGAALLRRGAPRSPPAVVRFGVAPPEHGSFGYFLEGRFIAASPDGSQIGYVAADPQGGQRIWVRPLSALEGKPIPGTEGASSLFWSPDGRSIGFFAGPKLKRVDLSGGAAVPICDVPAGFGKSGTWGRGGDILFSGIQSPAIYRVSSSGGEPAEVVRVDPSRGETRLRWPWFLPDGERFLYLAGLRSNTGSLMLVEPGKRPRALMPMVSAVQYCDPGYLVFCREGTLLGQRFDEKTGRLSGEPFPITEHVRYFLSTFSAAFALSRTGVLIYQDRDEESRLVWIDRTGREVGTVGQAGGYGGFSIAPDGRRVFFGRTRPGIGTPDIWSFDLERGVETRITSEAGSEFAPRGLQDGRHIVYSAARGDPPQLYLRDLATGKEDPVFPKAGSFQQAQDISPDGRTLAYVERSAQGAFEAWTISLSGAAKPAALLQSPIQIAQVRFSPDGRFIAFISADSGRSEAYVMPFPGPGEKTRVSTGGAWLLNWSPDGRELLYLSADRRLMSVPVRTTPALQLGSRAELFSLKGRDWKRSFGGEDAGFGVSPDGKRFLALVPEVVADELPLTVVLNWTAQVAEK